MPQTVQSITPTVEQLSERLRDLEQRVAALEGHSEKLAAPETQVTDIPLERPRPPATFRGFPPAQVPGGIVPVLGKAVLGIAGAYLLRAIAESGPIPKLPVLMVAIVYAALWMVWAVRTHDSSRFASVTYGTTSALILSPLLWESTVRFQVLPAAFTAVVLAAFVVLAIMLSWKHNLQVIPWVAMLAAVITAWALIIASHELVPLTVALVVVALATEVAVCLGHRLSLRAVPAVAADFAVLLSVYLLASPEGVPEGYHPASPGALVALSIALLAIYGSSISIRSFGMRQPITFFEIGQGIAAFALAAFGGMRATHSSAAPAFGVLALLLAAVCYWGALSRFADATYARNRRICATWAAALLLAGSFLAFPVSLQVPFLCLGAVAASFIHTRTAKLSLGLHSSLYLAAAAAASPLANYVASALAGKVPGAPEWGVWLVAVSAILCYAVGSRGTVDQGQRRLLWVVPAGIAGFASASLVVVAIVGLAANRVELAASRLSVVRTIVNCALALTLGFLGTRWKRIELGWVAYGAVAFGTLKLLFEDLRFGNAASLVVSLLFYGLILILLPRLTRRGRIES